MSAQIWTSDWHNTANRLYSMSMIGCHMLVFPRHGSARSRECGRTRLVTPPHDPVLSLQPGRGAGLDTVPSLHPLVKSFTPRSALRKRPHCLGVALGAEQRCNVPRGERPLRSWYVRSWPTAVASLHGALRAIRTPYPLHSRVVVYQATPSPCRSGPYSRCRGFGDANVMARWNSTFGSKTPCWFYERTIAVLPV